MKSTGKTAICLAVSFIFGFAVPGFAAPASMQENQPAPSPAASSRQIGAVKSITGNTIVLKTDSGAEVNVLVQDSTRLVRIAPGQNDLKSASPIQFSDLQVGDRMLVRGSAGEAAQSFNATTVIVMKQADVAQKQEQERAAWQHGIGGIVRAIGPASGAVTVATAPGRTVTVQTSKSTGFLRYAPDSEKFSDAKPGSFDEIKVGDQLRARGTRSTEGQEFAADQVISGSFRNIAGTILSTDAAGSSISVMDLLTRKPMTVKITADSQMRKLPPPMAQRMAFMLKGSGGPNSPQAAGGGDHAYRGKQAGEAGPATSSAMHPAGAPDQQSRPAGAPGAPDQPSHAGGAPDFQQMLNRLPATTLADLQKGDAVMIVSTQGDGAGGVTALTLLSGVEPILSAAPNGVGAAALLSNWNMSSSTGDSPSQ